MKTILRTLFALLLLTGAGCSSATDSGPALTKGEALAEAMAEAMGGRDAFASTRFLRFDWTVVRDGEEVRRMLHLWDCHSGRYRVEWQSREGERVQVLFNINDADANDANETNDAREGRAWKDGEEVTVAEDLDPLLERAYGRFINDSYWLLMPWKLRDPGVNLEHLGEKEVDGKTYEVLHVSFGEVGLTPGDQYWAFVDPETKMMERWAYFLQSFEGEASLEDARPFAWRKWETFGRMKLAREKVNLAPDSDSMIHFPVLAAYDELDEKIFEDPGVPMPGE